MTIKHDADPRTTAGFALFKDGNQISKAHSDRGVAMVEAFQRRVVLSWSQDFWSDKPAGLVMAEGYEVRGVSGT